MTLTLIPDGEKITANFLREHAEVAAIVGRRVLVQTAQNTDEPWIRYTVLDARNVTNAPVEHLMSYLVQLDCYAGRDGGNPEARLLARTVRAALHDEMPAATHDGAVVTKVEIVGDLRSPDTATEGARERVILTVQVYAHRTAG